MKTPDFHRRRILVAILALVGVAFAGVVGVLGLSDNPPVGPWGLSKQLIGSFCALLAICGGVALARRWSTPARALWARLDAQQTIGASGRRLSPRWLRRAATAAGLLGATLALASWLHDIAFTHDHSEHCFKAFHFWHEMLGRGRLRGWSHFLAFGYPAGELTPFGPELWVALFRAATLGLLSWTRTYALAFSGVVVFALSAVYLFTRRFFGGAAAVIATVIWALDPGGWYQGGWLWFEWLGVWPVTLAMSFALLALIKLADLLDEARAPETHDPRAVRRDVLWAALWMAASLVTHQLPIVVYAIAPPCLLLSAWLAPGRTSGGISRAGALRFAAALALGAGLAAFYLIPMFARNGLTQDLGVRGFALDDLAQRLVEMRLFEGGWSPIVVLGLFGIAGAIRDQPRAGLFFALCAGIFMLLSSDLLVGVFHAERLFAGIIKIECQRMLLIAKLFWFPLSAHAAVTFFRAPRADSAAQAPSLLRRLTAFLLIAALGTPLLAPVLLRLYQTQVYKSVEHRGDSPLAQDLKTFWSWSSAERAQHDENDEPYRIGYAMTDFHDHMVGLSPIFNRTQLYKVGYTSAQQFRNFPMSDEAPLLEALSVKFLVADHDLANPALVLERTFGQLRVYRVAVYHPRHPFTLTGAGLVDLVEFDPERVHLRLHDVSPGARLKLHVAIYPRWEARLNGSVVPIAPATVYGMQYPLLMDVPAGDGDLVFRYVRRAPDWIGLFVTLAALVAFAGACAYPALGAAGRLRSPRWWPRLRATLARLAPAAAWASGAVVLLAVAFAVWRMAVPARLAPDDLFAIASLPIGRDDGARGREGEILLGGNRCIARRAARWVCGPYRIEAGVVDGRYGTHMCLTAPAAGPLVVSASTVLGRFVEMTYDPDGPVRGRIRLSINGQSIGDETTRIGQQGMQFLQADTRPYAGKLARLSVEIEGGPLHCFDARIAR